MRRRKEAPSRGQRAAAWHERVVRATASLENAPLDARNTFGVRRARADAGRSRRRRRRCPNCSATRCCATARCWCSAAAATCCSPAIPTGVVLALTAQPHRDHRGRRRHAPSCAPTPASNGTPSCCGRSAHGLCRAGEPGADPRHRRRRADPEHRRLRRRSARIHPRGRGLRSRARGHVDALDARRLRVRLPRQRVQARARSATSSPRSSSRLPRTPRAAARLRRRRRGTRRDGRRRRRAPRRSPKR